MALKVKAREKLLKFSKDSEGVWKWVMQPELYSALTQSKVIKAWLPEGHSIPLPGLGSCRFSLSASSVDDVNKVKTSLIKTRRIIFTPAVELKDELKTTAVVITCYDRDGKEVKRVTSTDDAEVDDGTGENTGSTDSGNSGTTGNGGSSNGGNSGNSSSSNQTLASPTISGNTTFSESTQVTISGPDGAEIHYTTDGTVPTAESALYSEAFTLSATTTVKAIAIKNGVSSEVASRVFTKSSNDDGMGQD